MRIPALSIIAQCSFGLLVAAHPGPDQVITERRHRLLLERGRHKEDQPHGGDVRDRPETGAEPTATTDSTRSAAHKVSE